MKKDYELQLLARIGTNKDVYFQFADKITKEIFNKYPDVFDAMLKVMAENKEPSMHRLMNILPEKSDLILDMFTGIDTSINVDEIIDILTEDYAIRVINYAIIQASLKDKSTEKAEAISSGLQKLETTTKESSYDTMYNIALSEVENLDSNIETGVLTGFKFIDSLSAGLQPSDLIVIAAETSQGKTSLALSICHNIINKGKNVAFISMEMSQAQISRRLMTFETLMPWRDAKQNKELFRNAADQYKEKHLYIADISNVSIQNVIANIRSAKHRMQIDCVFIDYLQLIKDAKSQSREQEVGVIARSLKNLAKELDIPIVLLSQLSRPKQPGNHLPGLSRLRDSGQIEEAADLVWFIYRPEFYGLAEFEDIRDTKELAVNILAKGRNYGTGRFYTRFIERITRFSDTWHTDEQPNNTGFDGMQASNIEEDAPF